MSTPNSGAWYPDSKQPGATPTDDAPQGPEAHEAPKASEASGSSYSPYDRAKPDGAGPYAGAPYQPEPNSGSPTQDKSFLLSLLGLIGSLIFAPVGLILSYLGWKKAKEHGESTVLSLVGLIVSGVMLIPFLLVIGFFLVLLLFSIPFAIFA